MDPTGVLDLWNLFVVNIFGSFFVAVIALGLLMFVIMGVLGRMSIYSVTWYIVMFWLAMSLGYGYITLNILISLAILVAFYFSWKSYIDVR